MPPLAALNDARKATSRAACAFNRASFTVGAENANVINVAVQLQDPRAKNVVERVRCVAYLSDVTTGASITATVATSALAIGTNGSLLNTPVSAKMVDVITDASGRFDINIPQTAAPVTYYLVVVLPDGSLVVSGAITFA